MSGTLRDWWRAVDRACLDSLTEYRRVQAQLRDLGWRLLEPDGLPLWRAQRGKQVLVSRTSGGLVEMARELRPRGSSGA